MEVHATVRRDRNRGRDVRVVEQHIGRLVRHEDPAAVLVHLRLSLYLERLSVSFHIGTVHTRHLAVVLAVPEEPVARVGHDLVHPSQRIVAVLL